MDVQKTLTIRDLEQLSHPGAWLMDTIWTECSARGWTRTTISPSSQLKPWPNDNYHSLAHHAGMPSTHAESADTVGNRYETLATLLIATQQWEAIFQLTQLGLGIEAQNRENPQTTQGDAPDDGPQVEAILKILLTPAPAATRGNIPQLPTATPGTPKPDSSSMPSIHNHQATERRIGEDGLFAKKRKTLMFNGYEAQVGQLYAGMDLKKFY
jgi:hypothetical protein